MILLPLRNDIIRLYLKVLSSYTSPVCVRYFTGYLDLEMPDIDVTDRLGDPMLDSDIDDDQPETEMEDTNPIILVEQGKLTQQWRRKRKRIKIAVGVLAIVFGLAALAAIIYLLVRFLV